MVFHFLCNYMTWK